jgi:membrane protein implicated in regulation of membrane protease activity
MNAWWESLTPLLKVFWCIALFASFFQIIMFAGAIFGAGHDFDHDVSHDSSTGAEGAQILSIRTLIAGAVGFGWAGVLANQSGMSDLASMGFALVVGVVFMYLVFYMMRLLFSMRDDGTLNYQNAVGLTGRVYVTIPAKRTGAGQIEIMFQGRLVTAAAQTDGASSLPPQASIRVTAAQSDNTLIVEPVNV